MALEHLCSNIIISKDERNTTCRLRRYPNANWFRIRKGKLIQFSFNPMLTKKVHEIPGESANIEITAERHMSTVCYTVKFEDSKGNNLKLYYF